MPEKLAEAGISLCHNRVIAATVGFAFYVRKFGTYNATYGALGAVIVFLTWLYISAYIVLLGAELNRILERGVGTGD